MTGDEFLLLQSILIPAMAPLVQLWVMAFIVAGIALAILIFFLIVTREYLERV